MTERIHQFLNERIRGGDFPSAVFLVADRGKICFRGAVGRAVVEPEEIAADANTIYDLASLTKPLVTGLLAAILIERGLIEFDASAAEYLGNAHKSEIAFAPAFEDIRVSDLLTHRSGLPAWKPLYLIAKDRETVVAEICRIAPHWRRNSVIYSDLNFILLGFVLERVLGRRIDQAARDEIFTPLGLKNSFYNPDLSLLRRIAASERGNEFERQTCDEQGFLSNEESVDRPSAVAGRIFRDYLIWGEVHDGNAYFMSGAAGHAGLFSTVDDVFNLALQFLPHHSRLLKIQTCELFRTNFTAGMEEDRSFAFQLGSTTDSTAGTRLSPESFGHLGFTGTSLWIDPVPERVFILLTNRTHARKPPFVNINSVRRRFHETACEILDEK